MAKPKLTGVVHGATSAITHKVIENADGILNPLIQLIKGGLDSLSSAHGKPGQALHACTLIAYRTRNEGNWRLLTALREDCLTEPERINFRLLANTIIALSFMDNADTENQGQPAEQLSLDSEEEAQILKRLFTILDCLVLDFKALLPDNDLTKAKEIPHEQIVKLLQRYELYGDQTVKKFAANASRQLGHNAAILSESLQELGSIIDQGLKKFGESDIATDTSGEVLMEKINGFFARFKQRPETEANQDEKS